VKLILILLSIFPFWNAGGDCLVISRAYPGQVQSCAGEMVLKNGERIPLYNPELKRDVDTERRKETMRGGSVSILSSHRPTEGIERIFEAIW
jgi:hypothetical protein